MWERELSKMKVCGLETIRWHWLCCVFVLGERQNLSFPIGIFFSDGYVIVSHQVIYNPSFFNLYISMFFHDLSLSLYLTYFLLCGKNLPSIIVLSQHLAIKWQVSNATNIWYRYNISTISHTIISVQTICAKNVIMIYVI